jgi:methionyl-tRNA formyltransferase
MQKRKKYSTMRILFMGTPEIAEACLKTLCEAGLDVRAVFTQPDRPKGRGMALAPPPVKVYAQSRGIEVFQPLKLKKSLDMIERIDPELIVVVAYGKLLPKTVLDYPKYGCVNLHASLLPRHRGAAPIQAAIVSGDETGGVTTMYMAEGLDTGNMIFTEETPISYDDTADTLHDRYAEIGGRLLLKTIRAVEEGCAPSIPQDDSKATYAPPIKKEDALINWNRTSKEIRNLIRGYNSWPAAFTELNGQTFKVFKADIGGDKPVSEPGTVISSGPGGIEVATADGSLFITEIQAAGKRRMTAAEYLRGHQI